MRTLILALFLVPPLSGQQTASGSISGAGAVSLSAAPAPLQPTPAMGYNTWLYPFDTLSNQGQNNSWLPTEAFVHQQSDAMKATLGAYGYTLMSVDGGWGNRDGNGNIQAVPAQFPSGAAALGAYIHANGQQFGLYGTPAAGCLSGYAEQANHEYADAVAMIGFGVDFFKYDLCGASGTFPTSTAVRNETNYLFNQFRGRPVSFLVNFYYGPATFPSGVGSDSGQWYGAVGPNGASYLRIGSDNDAVGDPWYLKAFTQFDWSTFAPYQGIGRYLDPDNLMCQMKEGRPGNGSANVDAVSAAECQAQFSFYSIIAAPLVLAIPPSMVNAATLATITNTEVIAIDQDRLGIMGRRITAADVACGSSTCSVWLRKTTSGYALALFNPDATASHAVSVTWVQAGLTGTWKLHDAWAHSDLAPSASGYTATLPAWGSSVLTLTQ